MAKKPSKLQDKQQSSLKPQAKKTLSKEELFDDFFEIVEYTLDCAESAFGLPNLRKEFFGVPEEAFRTPSGRQAARIKARESMIWLKLSELYEYAVNGATGTIADGESSLVLDGAEMLKLLDTYSRSPCDTWFDLLSQADGRFALDSGSSIELSKMALLANVDVRTVRNAISSGELAAKKIESSIFVDNASARHWLMGRRGFKPSISESDAQDLDQVKTPADFGAFLTRQRKRLGLDAKDKLVVMHPQVNAAALAEIEKGVFRLPLDAAFPIADFYRLNRKHFLRCVMELFFHDQLATLREVIKEGARA